MRLLHSLARHPRESTPCTSEANCPGQSVRDAGSSSCAKNCYTGLGVRRRPEVTDGESESQAVQERRMGSGHRAQAPERRTVARAGQVARRLARCLEAWGRRAGQLCAAKLARGDRTEKGG